MGLFIDKVRANALKIVAWALGVGMVAALAWGGLQWANAQHWEKKFLNERVLTESAKRKSAEQKAANEKRIADATADYAERLASVQPIILKSKETVREYAQTPAGRVPCLSAERVQMLDALDASLNDPVPAGGTQGAVRNSADSATGGR